MKHQYFGDINDYRKYGLLRAFQRAGLTIGVCWMLTPDDNRTDGGFISYLREPKFWRRYDPDLFDALAGAIPVRRHLDDVTASNMLPGAVLFETVIPDERQSRERVMGDAHQRLSTTELVFFDPDNGFEVASRPIGRTGSNRYVRWAEVERAYANGQSVLVYQHFPRESRQVFVDRISRQFASRTAGAAVACYSTANVGFFLAVQPRHVDAVESGTAAVAQAWADQFAIRTLHSNLHGI